VGVLATLIGFVCCDELELPQPAAISAGTEAKHNANTAGLVFTAMLD
jgi:hypothetical protein